jgi:peptidoglycan/LPS O-acetylase OafA/YrhL
LNRASAPPDVHRDSSIGENSCRRDAGLEPVLRPRMPELDTLRGIAILGVVCLHGIYSSVNTLSFDGAAKWVIRASQFGWVGVNLFFVLSGFLITGILLDSKSSGHYFVNFYARRALRILPAYYLLLILLAVIGHATWAYLILCFFYLANVTTLFGVPEDYGPLWSLAVEEHYYLLWPVIVHRLSRRAVGVVAILVCVLTAFLRGWAFYRGHRVGIASFTWLVADGLALGSLLAVVVRGNVKRRELRTISVAAIVLGMVVAGTGAPFGILTRDRLLGAMFQYSVIHLLFAGVLLGTLLIGSSAHRRWINIGWVQFLGYLSYGLYLIHLLAFRIYDRTCRAYFPSLLVHSGQFELVVLRFVIAGGAAVALAYVSRRYFEEPFLRLKSRWGKR